MTFLVVYRGSYKIHFIALFELSLLRLRGFSWTSSRLQHFQFSFVYLDLYTHGLWSVYDF